jgi:redox-sensing transcriptional repressor
MLEAEGVLQVSSQELGDRFHLSPSQIRRDLANFGGFGVRGVGYDVASLADRLHRVLRLDALHRLIVVGMGNLGTALSSYLGFNDLSFEVVAGVDSDPDLIGQEIAGVLVEPFSELASVARRSQADIGVLTVPAEAAAGAFEALVGAGLRAVLNFAPVMLEERSGVRVKNVDLRIHLEELAAHLGGAEIGRPPPEVSSE